MRTLTLSPYEIILERQAKKWQSLWRQPTCHYYFLRQVHILKKKLFCKTAHFRIEKCMIQNKTNTVSCIAKNFAIFSNQVVWHKVYIGAKALLDPKLIGMVWLYYSPIPVGLVQMISTCRHRLRGRGVGSAPGAPSSLRWASDIAKLY